MYFKIKLFRDFEILKILILKYQFLGFAKDVLNSNSILLLVLHRQEILCFVEDDLTTRPDMSGLSWGMLWDIS